MKSLLACFGLVALGCCQVANAQNLLSNVSLAETVTAGTTSIDYRYTMHTRSGSGRGGGYRRIVYYTWDPFTDQATSVSLPLQLGATSSATSAGTFYGPTYSATSTALTSLTNTPTKAALTANFTASTTVTTPLAAHQAVSVTAQPGGTINFTLTSYTNVTVTATGSANGVFQFSGSGLGVLIGLYGAGTATANGSLPPGSYWITTSLPYTSGLNTQLGTSTNPGTTSAAYGFTVTFTPGSEDTGIGD